MNNYVFNFSTRIVSGAGAINKVGEEVKKFGAKNLLIATDPFLMQSKIIDVVTASLAQEGVEYVLFPQVQPDPSVECVQDACTVLLNNNCNAVLGLGGGSAIDVAKGAAILATNPGPIAQYEGADKIPNCPLPIFAIPTTAGTGSEVSQTSVLSDGEAKRSIRSVMATPKVAFLDPMVLETVPRKVAISSGLDALAHNIESYVSLWASPMTECLSEFGIKLAAENLRQHIANPKNAEAANNMQLSAMLGAAAFVNSRVGLPHALGMALGGVVHIPHGLGCGLGLAPCIEYSWIANPKKYKRIAELMGENVAGLSDEEGAQRVVPALKKLFESLDTPMALSAYGVKEEHLEALAAEMIRPGLHLTDPRQADVNDARAILAKAMNYNM